MRPATSGRTVIDSSERRLPTAVIVCGIDAVATVTASTVHARPLPARPARPCALRHCRAAGASGRGGALLAEPDSRRRQRLPAMSAATDDRHAQDACSRKCGAQTRPKQTNYAPPVRTRQPAATAETPSSTGWVRENQSGLRPSARIPAEVPPMPEPCVAIPFRLCFRGCSGDRPSARLGGLAVSRGRVALRRKRVSRAPTEPSGEARRSRFRRAARSTSPVGRSRRS